MARELRIIQLEYSELSAAVQSYLRVNLEIVGAVIVTGVSVGESGHITVCYQRSMNSERREPDLTLTQEQASAVLIRFCLENNIPLPRKGEKTAIRSGDSLALRVQCGAIVGSAAETPDAFAQAVASPARCAAP